MSSFKRSRNIQKKEGGPDRPVSDNQSSSLTLNQLAMKARINPVYDFSSKTLSSNTTVRLLSVILTNGRVRRDVVFNEESYSTKSRIRRNDFRRKVMEGNKTLGPKTKTV